MSWQLGTGDWAGVNSNFRIPSISALRHRNVSSTALAKPVHACRSALRLSASPSSGSRPHGRHSSIETKKQMQGAKPNGEALDQSKPDGPAAWQAACITLALLSISFGSSLLIVVGLKPIAEALSAERAVVALAGSLVWVGTGAGGILMGWLADRIGVRATVALGVSMVAGGLAVSSLGSVWALYIGHGLMVGLLGNGALYPPLLVYVSRWFDRRRGTAIALISSGQYVAGVIWPTIFERGMAAVGWQAVMLWYAVALAVLVLPVSLLLKPAPIAADLKGGLGTVLAGSSCQALAIAAFLLTREEVGLFAISAAFGFAFAGIIPAYAVTIRDLFPSPEASWRIPLTLFTAMTGMAVGSWFGGALYDKYGYYDYAFGSAVLFNIANLGIIGFLFFRVTGTPRSNAATASP